MLQSVRRQDLADVLDGEHWRMFHALREHRALFDELVLAITRTMNQDGRERCRRIDTSEFGARLFRSLPQDWDDGTRAAFPGWREREISQVFGMVLWNVLAREPARTWIAYDRGDDLGKLFVQVTPEQFAS